MNALLNFFNQHFNANIANILNLLTVVAILIIVVWVLGLVIKQCLAFIASKTLKNSSSKFLQDLTERQVFQSLFHMGAGLVFYCISSLIFSSDTNYASFADWLRRLSLMYVIFGVLWFLTKLARGINYYYQSFDYAKKYPINSYLEVVTIFVWLIGLILAIAILIDKSPWALLTGLGAVSAVVLLIFKDSITGLIASIEAYIYQIAKVGDWIVIPSLNVNGKIELITVNTVKIRNWDNTLASFPTSSLMSSSLQNWSGMYEKKARLIKRTLLIDARSVAFCTPELLAKVGSLNGMQKVITSYENQAIPNTSLFRHYLENYLRQHPKIYQAGFDLLVRNLDMTPTGFPIEIYAFSIDTAWNHYETIQADIVDHAMAMMAEFGLRPYQE
ncbi:MAG: mechanosensitive ion channel family protein [Gammaproteobacteria bacterium]|nr:mechanosensitive ion channel family protein [Gammaproteobacteria bacterium]